MHLLSAVRPRLAFIGVVLLVLPACGGDSPLSPQQQVGGRYNLVSVNGAPLPFDEGYLSDIPYRVTESATLELRQDGTVVQIRRGRFVRADGTAPAFVDSLRGTWSLAGDTVVTDAFFDAVQRRPWLTYLRTTPTTLTAFPANPNIPWDNVVYRKL